jgi:hypothetical protein
MFHHISYKPIGDFNSLLMVELRTLAWTRSRPRIFEAWRGSDNVSEELAVSATNGLPNSTLFIASLDLDPNYSNYWCILLMHFIVKLESHNFLDDVYLSKRGNVDVPI